MTPRGQKYLFDIRCAIERIEQFVVDTPTFALYQADLKIRSAMERQLAITGEVVNHLRRVGPEAKLPNTKQMVDFRNCFIHSCDNVNEAIVSTHLPTLKADVQIRLTETR